jgi:hypothetical protein
VVLIGINLCGMLSLRAAQLFNDHPVCTRLALKPCCLPPIQMAKKQCVWRLGSHLIPACEVCVPGKFVKGQWIGASEIEQREKFSAWCSHLQASLDGGLGGSADLVDWQLQEAGEGKQRDDIMEEVTSSQADMVVGGQHSKRYQTVFLFGSRPHSGAASVGTISEIMLSSK